MRPDARALVLLAAAALSVAPAGAALAHPLGNFSINRYSAIRVEPGAVRVRYVVDLAEIPTFQELQDAGLAAEADRAALAPYLDAKARALASGIALEQDGRPLRLDVESGDVIFPPGAGGLPTMKLAFTYRAALAPPPDCRPDPACKSGSGLHYRDGNFAGRAGWQEIVAEAGPEVALSRSSVPERDRSRALTDYPTDLLQSPPQVTEARLVFAVGGAPRAVADSRAAEADRGSSRPAGVARSAARTPPGAASPPIEPVQAARPAEASIATSAPEPVTPALDANRQGTPRSAFTELVTAKELGLGAVLFAAAVVAVLGALHALEPGHGKTMVGAYLVGSRGTASHAVLLGLIVTASHTAGVYLLGGATLFASRYVVPERLYPWLGVASGLIVAAVGVALLRQRFRGGAARAHGHHQGHVHSHDHDHAHGQHHGPDSGHAHPHHHGHAGHAHGGADGHRHATGDGPLPLRQLLALGISGGIVPCPAALVVLLSALALHRVGFGLLLIVAFSAGLAAVLIGIGLLLVHARRFMARFDGGGGLVTRWLPVTSAAVITILGLGMVIQALASTGLALPLPFIERIG